MEEEGGAEEKEEHSRCIPDPVLSQKSLGSTKPTHSHSRQFHITNILAVYLIPFSARSHWGPPRGSPDHSSRGRSFVPRVTPPSCQLCDDLGLLLHTNIFPCLKKNWNAAHLLNDKNNNQSIKLIVIITIIMKYCKCFISGSTGQWAVCHDQVDGWNFQLEQWKQIYHICKKYFFFNNI